MLLNRYIGTGNHASNPEAAPKSGIIRSQSRRAIRHRVSDLLKAPDDYADLRLEADMMISERDLSAKNADVKMRTQALTELIARYRHTPGEMKSLMMASLIAPKLEAFELEKQIFRVMDGRFCRKLRPDRVAS